MSTPYRLTGRIEEGELAELYKATQQPGGDVVVKLFHPRTSDPDYARNLAETSRLLGALRHPGIVQYLDIGFVKQRLAVVREYVDGFTLGTALHRLHTKEVLLPTPLALYFVIQLLDAAQRAHDSGIVHGAITPGNIMLSRAGVPSLADFGALRALLAVPQLKATFAGRGRSAYRAPEVSRGEPATEQSDVYSLGAIAYELLTLREPEAPGGGLSTRREGLPPPSRLDRRINSRLDPIVMRALDPSPQRRFRSCGEFAQALRNFLGASGGMPGTDDLRRFASELFPNEVNLVTLGPAAFTESFLLTPVTGAEISDLHAEALEKSVIIRPTFSRSALTEEESNAETVEAAPAFEEFKPPEPARAFAPQEPGPAEEPAVRGTAAQYPGLARDEATATQAPAPVHPMLQDEHTVAASMQWEAPPGAEPPKPVRRQAQQSVPLGGEADSPQLTRSGRHPRMKVVEDYTATPTVETTPTVTRLPPSMVRANPVAQAQEAQSSTRVGQPPRDRPPPVVQAVFFPESRAAAAVADRSEVPMPPPTSDDVPAQRGFKPGKATQLRLRAFENRRMMAMAIAGGIAIVGVLAFLTAAWQLNDADKLPPPPAEAPAPVDPKATASTGPLQDYLEKQQKQAQQPRPEPARPKAQASEASERDDAPPSVHKDSAFLTLRANVAARVYIDGERVNRRLPLVRYPVKPGTRTITVESLGSAERRQFSMRFNKGQHRVMEETFTANPGR